MKSALCYREGIEFSEEELRQLSQLLIDVVEDGASLGFYRLCNWKKHVPIGIRCPMNT